VLEGIPGLSDIPGLGRLFTHTRKEAQETDILLTLTPHIVRVLDLSEADLRPFRVRSGTAGPLIDLPSPEAPPARDRPPQFQDRPPNQGQPAPGAQPIGPITPPVAPPQERPAPEPPDDSTTPPG
jgi:general secretion pathway protein D